MRAPARLLHSSSASSSSSADLPSSSSPAITVDSDMVVILASLLCALICVAGLALVARCACRRRSSAATNPAAASSAPAAPSSRAAGGLKKKAIDALPTVSFAADAAEKHQHQHQQQHAECAICLAEFAGGEELRVLPHCGHGFHLHCIDTWLGAHATCPSCRAAIIVVNNAKLKPVAVAVPGRCRRCGEMDPEAMIH